MKKMLTALLAAAVAGALFVAAPLVAAPPGTEHFNKATERPSGQDCGDGNSLAISAPTKLWPPNHKYFDEDLYVVARDEDGGEISLTTTGTHNQYDNETGEETNGAGNTVQDITVIDDNASATPDSTDAQPAAEETGDGEVQTDWAARAERSGRDKGGRIYTLSGTAVFEDGSCSWSYNFAVPHDMRPSNRGDDVDQPEQG